MLGLVCDPVGGLVEYPCQNRNAAGVANGLIAAELALSGIHQLIPFDDMLNTMYQVGRRIPYELRETALGGCAASPFGVSSATNLVFHGIKVKKHISFRTSVPC